MLYALRATFQPDNLDSDGVLHADEQRAVAQESFAPKSFRAKKPFILLKYEFTLHNFIRKQVIECVFAFKVILNMLSKM
ncbi:hypothetical protein BCT27_03485 [Enterovibrio norvegicus]|nr:hypothetical protein A1OU_23755 [Enterovibrio norvegicus]PMN70782.1 hypothetical protein BCT27_03485 [Enterovibrio norvegicus]